MSRGDVRQGTCTVTGNKQLAVLPERMASG